MLEKEIKSKCKKCGKPLEPERLISVGTCRACEKKERESVKGIGGWLLFFIITLVFIQPILYFYSFIRYKYFFSLLLLVFSLIAGISLWGRTKRAVKITKAYLTTLMVMGALAVFWNCQADPVSCASYLREQSGVLFIYPAIWLTYLRKSRRVKNTYGGI